MDSDLYLAVVLRDSGVHGRSVSSPAPDAREYYSNLSEVSGVQSIAGAAKRKWWKKWKFWEFWS
jgi:hypothetical protein